MKQLSDKYDLPVTSIHQPPWSVGGLWFDEGFIAEAAKIGVENFVFHPPSRLSFEDNKMIDFLEKLAELQKKYGVNALLENMPWAVRPSLLRKYLPYPTDTCDPEKVHDVAKKYGLGMTLDTSHVFNPTMHKESWFKELLKGVNNIHLSSFTEGRDHLPLDQGDGFIEELKRRKYKGLITLEIFYPKKVSLIDYDYDSIKRSIDLVKS